MSSKRSVAQLESGPERETALATSEAAITKRDSAQPVASVDVLNDLHEAAALADTPATWVRMLEGDESQPLAEMLEKALGVEGRSFVSRLFSETAIAGDPVPNSDTFREIAQALVSLKPEGGDQAMLAAQMVGIHKNAMRALRMASNAKTNEDMEILTNRATKLMRLFTTQVELMARLKGTISQQRIVVEKVDVRDGGQAAIGVLNQRGPGEGSI